MSKILKRFLFQLWTCGPKAKTFGTIYYKGFVNQVLYDYKGVRVVTDGKDHDYKNYLDIIVDYRKVVYLYVEASTITEAHNILKTKFPGLNEIRKLEGKEYPVGRYWSYSR